MIGCRLEKQLTLTLSSLLQGVWYHFNDSTVTETDLNSVLKCKAYILFYIRREWRIEETSEDSTSSSSASSVDNS